jgi:TRAP-type C4-dicarboxylate transport system permease small subunit
VFALALLIIADVAGRTLFLHPIPGTKEILQNSVIAVTFLQLPMAIYSGSMLRTTLILDRMGPTAARLMRGFAWGLGAALFAAIAYASWPAFMDAIRLGEYEGAGSLRIYSWPVRGLLVATTIFAAIACVSMLVADLRGQLGEDGRPHPEQRKIPLT